MCGPLSLCACQICEKQISPQFFPCLQATFLINKCKVFYTFLEFCLTVYSERTGERVALSTCSLIRVLQLFDKCQFLYLMFSLLCSFPLLDFLHIDTGYSDITVPSNKNVPVHSGFYTEMSCFCWPLMYFQIICQASFNFNPHKYKEPTKHLLKPPPTL